MSWGFSWRPYVSAAQRRAKAAREAARLRKTGRSLSPVVLNGRTISTTFWGKAWCSNLEAYSDFENRLPRGRTYIRNGSVMDLQIGAGKVNAMVSGSEIYKVEIKIKPLAGNLWQSLKSTCAGKIESLLDLLQARLSAAVMQLVARRETGLFPNPSQITMACSCPDWAGMCKHDAATLYGVGARLDEQPELLFLLRGVDPAELISGATRTAVRDAVDTNGAPALAESELADVFGIEIDTASAPNREEPETPVQPSLSRPKEGQRRKPAHRTPRAKPKPTAKAKRRPHGAIRKSATGGRK